MTKRSVRVFSANPTYEEWCRENGLDPNDDNNHDAYCEWRSNQ